MSALIRSAKGIAVSLLACAVMLITLSPALSQKVQAGDLPLPQPVTHLRLNTMEELLLDYGQGVIGKAAYKNPPSPICSTSTSTSSDINTDCEGIGAHNETSIAVNPTNPLNMIGGANDIQYRITSDNSYDFTLYTRARVTFDGGKTWTTYPIDYSSYVDTGDPAVSFDASGTAYLATLGFVESQGYGSITNPDILVSHSNNGGKTWSTPSIVAAGTGSWGSVGLANDKEYITAWGKGNAIATWTEFNDGIGGSYISSPIFASVTHDGGNTWSTPAEISGSADFCIGAQGGDACNQSQASVPIIGADGSIYVAFLNTADANTWRDQYLVVKVDPSTSQRVAGPYQVGLIYDSISDYPYNVNGYPTHQDSQFRSWSVGNIAADPTNADHLAVIWSDMRNSTLPAPPDPYSAKTNADIIISQSFDGGISWSQPAVIAKPGDQFMPWGAYDATGKLRIGYFDRSYDPANHKFGYTLATEKKAGSLNFTFIQMTTSLSNPTSDDLWWASKTLNPAFPNPTRMMGDYSNIAVTPGGVVGLWTDLRVNTCFNARCAAGEDIFFAPAQ